MLRVYSTLAAVELKTGLCKGQFMAICQNQVKDGARIAKQSKMVEQLYACLHSSTLVFSCLT